MSSNSSNRYPNYLGYKAKLLNSVSLQLEYTGESKKSVIICEGSLVSIGHVVDNNGGKDYELVLGIVKEVHKVKSYDPYKPNHNLMADCFTADYIVVDTSTNYNSNVKNIFLKDIRDIIVGPLAEGEYGKGELYGERLPVINEATKDLYLGKFFYLTEKEDYNNIGIYFGMVNEWKYVTSNEVLESSPLINKIEDDSFLLKDTININGKTIISNINAAIVSNGIGKNSKIKMSRIGNVVYYQLHIESLPFTESEIETNKVTLDITLDNNIKPTGYTSLNTNKIVIDDKNFYDIYHRIDTDGKLIIYYPNKDIGNIDITGTYLI